MHVTDDIALIEEFCMTDDLRSYDPYDIWMTGLGIRVKQLYNKNKFLGVLPAASLTIWDQFLNNKQRFFYTKQEYPTARAMAALTLLEVYSVSKREAHLTFAKKHIDWLLANPSKGYSGLCWGLGFKWAAGDDLDYDENTPFSTHTPYVLEAIHRYIQLSGDTDYITYVKSIFEFYENDLQIMFEDEDTMATSYGPSKDRLVTNAVSYTLYAYALFYQYIPDEESLICSKIKKLYQYILKKQRPNGSWLYEPDSLDSFIDCFHSCFILKNIYKTNSRIPLPDSEAVVESGYDYVKKNFYNPEYKLFKRFTLSNKPSIIKFDLYDNAEMLHLSVLLEDNDLSRVLLASIREKLVSQNGVYSTIDLFNRKGNKNTLRWATMPYLYALATNYKRMGLDVKA